MDKTKESVSKMKLRPLEKRDLSYIYEQENSRRVMALWFEEPYSSFDELQILYDRHILDQTERRFVIEDNESFIGVVELMDIDTLHRHTEIQIIIHSKYQGHGYAQSAMKAGIEYAFTVLNMPKSICMSMSKTQQLFRFIKKLVLSLREPCENISLPKVATMIVS